MKMLMSRIRFFTIATGFYLLQLVFSRWTQVEAGTTQQQRVKQYCEGESFEADCAKDHVIFMISATYGRMRRGKCLQGHGQPECRRNVITHFDQLCSGRHRCQVKVSSIVDSLGPAIDACLRENRGYLEASFTCLKVTYGEGERCSSHLPGEGATKLGYLANIISDDTGCGQYDRPWYISAPTGQKLKFTLYNFMNVDVRPTPCTVYAIIKESKPNSHPQTICKKSQREMFVYTSQGNHLEVRLSTKEGTSQAKDYFLLKYQVIGCPDLVAPPGGWAERNGEISRLGCNNTGRQWEKRCEKDSWDGGVYNCIEEAARSDKSNEAIVGILTGPQWASIVIILSIAVTLGLVIFLVGLVFLRRRRQSRARQRAMRERCSAPEYSSQTHDPNIDYSTKPMHKIDTYPCMENDYYRTWQMQQHQASGRDTRSSSLPPTTSNIPYSSAKRSHNRTTEHVYESPKFERKDASVDSDNDSQRQYYELDPHAARRPAI